MGLWKLKDSKIADTPNGGCVVTFKVIETSGIIEDGRARLLDAENKRLRQALNWISRASKSVEPYVLADAAKQALAAQ